MRGLQHRPGRQPQLPADLPLREVHGLHPRLQPRRGAHDHGQLRHRHAPGGRRLGALRQRRQGLRDQVLADRQRDRGQLGNGRAHQYPGLRAEVHRILRRHEGRGPFHHHHGPRGGRVQRLRQPVRWNRRGPGLHRLPARHGQGLVHQRPGLPLVPQLRKLHRCGGPGQHLDPRHVQGPAHRVAGRRGERLDDPRVDDGIQRGPGGRELPAAPARGALGGGRPGPFRDGLRQPGLHEPLGHPQRGKRHHLDDGRRPGLPAGHRWAVPVPGKGQLLGHADGGGPLVPAGQFCEPRPFVVHLEPAAFGRLRRPAARRRPVPADGQQGPEQRLRRDGEPLRLHAQRLGGRVAVRLDQLRLDHGRRALPRLARPGAHDLHPAFSVILLPGDPGALLHHGAPTIQRVLSHQHPDRHPDDHLHPHLDPDGALRARDLDRRLRGPVPQRCPARPHEPLGRALGDVGGPPQRDRGGLWGAWRRRHQQFRPCHRHHRHGAHARLVELRHPAVRRLAAHPLQRRRGGPRGGPVLVLRRWGPIPGVPNELRGDGQRLLRRQHHAARWPMVLLPDPLCLHDPPRMGNPNRVAHELRGHRCHGGHVQDPGRRGALRLQSGPSGLL